MKVTGPEASNDLTCERMAMAMAMGWDNTLRHLGGEGQGHQATHGILQERHLRLRLGTDDGDLEICGSMGDFYRSNELSILKSPMETMGTMESLKETMETILSGNCSPIDPMNLWELCTMFAMCHFGATWMYPDVGYSMTVNYPCKPGKHGTVLTKRWRGLLLHFALAPLLALQNIANHQNRIWCLLHQSAQVIYCSCSASVKSIAFSRILMTHSSRPLGMHVHNDKSLNVPVKNKVQRSFEAAIHILNRCCGKVIGHPLA